MSTRYIVRQPVIFRGREYEPGDEIPKAAVAGSEERRTKGGVTGYPNIIAAARRATDLDALVERGLVCPPDCDCGEDHHD